MFIGWKFSHNKDVNFVQIGLQINIILTIYHQKLLQMYTANSKMYVGKGIWIAKTSFENEELT